MTAPGLAMFYGGLVRRKNVLSTMMQSFFILCLISIQWVLWGYSLAFGPDVGHLFGNLSWFGLNGVGLTPNPDYAATIPHQLFMVFQMMFAVITPALITGAFAERIKFSTFVVFTLLWATLVYDPIAHWVWGKDGWLHNLGALDFAGGTVVHMSSGMSALVVALVIGRRTGVPAHHPAAAQHDLHAHRRGPPVVRLVRVQRGKRRPGQRACRVRLHQHEHGNRHGGHRVGDHRLVRHPQADGARRGHGRRGGACRHHPRLRVRHPRFQPSSSVSLSRSYATSQSPW